MGLNILNRKFGGLQSQGGSAKVHIQAISSTTCQVTADIDGDGAYDDTVTISLLSDRKIPVRQE